MRSAKVQRELDYQRELAALAPLIVPARDDRIAREIPDALDRKRADALLKRLTEGQISELKSWMLRPEWMLKQIKLGQPQFEVVPHRLLNLISNELGYHWNGVDYV